MVWNRQCLEDSPGLLKIIHKLSEAVPPENTDQTYLVLPPPPMIATKHIEPLLVVRRQFDDTTGVLVEVPDEEPPGVVPAVC